MIVLRWTFLLQPLRAQEFRLGFEAWGKVHVLAVGLGHADGHVLALRDPAGVRLGCDSVCEVLGQSRDDGTPCALAGAPWSWSVPSHVVHSGSKRFRKGFDTPVVMIMVINRLAVGRLARSRAGS